MNFRLKNYKKTSKSILNIPPAPLSKIADSFFSCGLGDGVRLRGEADAFLLLKITRRSQENSLLRIKKQAHSPNTICAPFYANEATPKADSVR